MLFTQAHYLSRIPIAIKGKDDPINVRQREEINRITGVDKPFTWDSDWDWSTGKWDGHYVFDAKVLKFFDRPDVFENIKSMFSMNVAELPFNKCLVEQIHSNPGEPKVSEFYYVERVECVTDTSQTYKIRWVSVADQLKEPMDAGNIGLMVQDYGTFFIKTYAGDGPLRMSIEVDNNSENMLNVNWKYYSHDVFARYAEHELRQMEESEIKDLSSKEEDEFFDSMRKIVAESVMRKVFNSVAGLACIHGVRGIEEGKGIVFPQQQSRQRLQGYTPVSQYRTLTLGHYITKEGRPVKIKGDTVGSFKKMHLRAGHWRNQRVGEGRQQIKRIAIAPMIVNYKPNSEIVTKATVTKNPKTKH